MSLLTPAQIDRLLSGQSISDRMPWSSGDAQQVDDFYRAVCADIMRETGTQSRIERGHYGSGYASYIDAWFYRPDPSFKPKHPLGYEQEYAGLILLLSRLSPCAVMMEGSKGWSVSNRTAASYMPAATMVDELENTVIIALAARVQALLESHGIRRLSHADLAAPLAPALSVPTILTDPPYTEFDALFHWED